MDIKKCRNSIIINIITVVFSVLCFIGFYKAESITVYGWLIIAVVDFIVMIKNIGEYIKLKKQNEQQTFFEKQE